MLVVRVAHFPARLGDLLLQRLRLLEELPLISHERVFVGLARGGEPTVLRRRHRLHDRRIEQRDLLLRLEDVLRRVRIRRPRLTLDRVLDRVVDEKGRDRKQAGENRDRERRLHREARLLPTARCPMAVAKPIDCLVSLHGARMLRARPAAPAESAESVYSSLPEDDVVAGFLSLSEDFESDDFESEESLPPSFDDPALVLRA